MDWASSIEAYRDIVAADLQTHTLTLLTSFTDTAHNILQSCTYFMAVIAGVFCLKP